MARNAQHRNAGRSGSVTVCHRARGHLDRGKNREVANEWRLLDEPPLDADSDISEARRAGARGAHDRVLDGELGLPRESDLQRDRAEIAMRTIGIAIGL